MNSHSQNSVFDARAYCEGIEARTQGTPRTENPYRDETLCSDCWYEGWDEGYPEF